MRSSLLLPILLAFGLTKNAFSARSKKVFIHYLPWYDAAGLRYAPRTGWCYPNSGTFDCTDPATIHYTNTPLIGEYSLFDDAVLEYHLLLIAATGIDAIVVNINPGSAIQKDGAIALMDRIVSLKATLGTPFDVKVIVSYDDGGMQSDQTVIESYMQWTYDRIYTNATYAPILFHDDETGHPVYMTWSESDPSFYWDTVNDLFSNNVFVIVRNAVNFQYSHGNMEWVADPNTGCPQTNTQNWGQAYFDHFDWGMARQTMLGVPPFTVNTLKVGNVYPGFDDGNVFTFWTDEEIPRYILRTVAAGNTLDLIWQQQLNYVPQRLGGSDVVDMPWVQVVTWNDWPEGSSVEPANVTTGYGYAAVETCREKGSAFKGTVAAFDAECLYVPAEVYSLRKAGSHSEADEMVVRMMQNDCALPSATPCV